MRPSTRLEGEQKSGVIYAYLFISATLTVSFIKNIQNEPI